MAKRKKKVQPVIPAEPVVTTGQWYWCVNCGHHGDFGFHRKNNVKCEMCGYDDVSLWTLEEINDEHLDNIWLGRFKTKKQADKDKAKGTSLTPKATTESKEPKKKSVQEQLAEIRGIT